MYLLMLQAGLALGGQLILLGRALFVREDLLGSLSAWAAAAGGVLGWASLAASLAALTLWYRQQRRPLPWGWLFTGGLAAVSLLGCTVERTWPAAGCYFLLVGWPGYVMLWSLLALLGGERRLPTAWSSGLSFAAFTDAAALVLLPNLAALAWALQVAITRHDYLWGAAAVGLCSAAAAVIAVAQRNQGLAFLAGLGTNLAASLLVWGLHAPSLPSWVSVVQVNVIAASCVALAWLAVRRFLQEHRTKPLVAVQAWLGLAINTLLLSLPLLRIAANPAAPPLHFLAEIGSSAGWLALLLAAAAADWHIAVRRPRGRLHVLGIAGLALGVLIACTLGPWDTGNWRCFHILLMAWCVLGLSAAIAGSVAFSPAAGRLRGLFSPRVFRTWVEGIGLAILVLLLPNAWRDPHRPIAPAGAVLTVSGMAGMLALWTRRAHYVWISGLLLDLLAVLFWSSWGPGTVLSFLLTNAIGLGTAASLWSAIGLSQTPRDDLSIARRPHSSFTAFAANAALGLVIFVVVLLLGSDFEPPRIDVSGPFAWCTVAATAAALALALLDRRSVFALPGLYVLGLSAVGLVLHQGTQGAANLGWWAALALAGYLTLMSLLAVLVRIELPPWFLPTQASIAALVVVVSMWMCLGFAAPLDRLAGPAAVLLLLPAALALIDRGGADTETRRQGDKETRRQESGVLSPCLLVSLSPCLKWLRAAALLLGAIAAVEIGWACPDPAGPAPWLHRNVLLLVALAGMTALYGIALPRGLAHDEKWVRCGRRFGPILGILASLTVLLLLVQEFRLYDAATRRTPMTGPEILVLVAALLTLMLSGIRFAVVSGRDPFGLSERGRTLYVYAVEVLLVLLFLHVRLNVPGLFRGWGAKYWTLIVMLIAFVGVGLSEFFERRKLRVLAEPLQRTGVFLPLLPLLAFWAKPPAPLLHFADANAPGLRPLLGYLDKLPQHFDSYAFLWLLVTALYGLLFWTRRSFVFALLAALAANFALWSLLAHQGIAFLLHPQCWLIPPALILLAAEHASRDQLRPEWGAGLRYLGISMIYVSSTADLFLAGLGNSIVLPIILAVLSLAGILLGILFRVRAFLFLGISFLFLDVFTMIWYAAVDQYQTWVWWVAGIILGAGILTLFAIFEKRRNDVLQLLEEIKRWD